MTSRSTYLSQGFSVQSLLQLSLLKRPWARSHPPAPISISRSALNDDLERPLGSTAEPAPTTHSKFLFGFPKMRHLLSSLRRSAFLGLRACCWIWDTGPLEANGPRPADLPAVRDNTTAFRSWLIGAALSALLTMPSWAEAQFLRHTQSPRIVVLASDAAAPPGSPPSSMPTGLSVGPVTGRPLPRFASLRRDEGNARHGPSIEEPVDWVFVRENMPLRIIAEEGGWRRVEDRDGKGGWVHFALLSGTRTVIVNQDLRLRIQPQEGAREIALLEQNVIARLASCETEWCWISAGGLSGWAPRTALWGVLADEVLD